VTTMIPYAEQALTRYTAIYEKVYRRAPRDAKSVPGNWVIVNGAQMRVGDLELLTHQLEEEYRQQSTQKKTVINKLIGWLKKPAIAAP